MRRLGVPVLALLAGLVLAGCGGGSSNGTMPTPAGDDGSTSTTPTPSGKPTSKPSDPGKTTPAKGADVIVVPGGFSDNPAVQGYVNAYPVYFRALVQRDPKIIQANFPAYFASDVSPNIAGALRRGWVMRPPGSVVVVGVEQRPFGVVRIRSCRSQTAGFWNPKTRRWVQAAPKGVPETVDMVERGDGWTMYRWLQPVPKSFSCAKVHYPA
ncbi:MAG TPA: hypothetical protein VFT31_03725 [Kribbella sp.]|nr:hypothetical protein [Kribbella sp.]